jgi:hypothetical protein
MNRILALLTDPILLPLALALVAAVARVAYAIVSHVVAPHPRARAAVEAVVALLPDVLRSGLQLVAVATGRAPPTLDVRLPDPMRARVTAQMCAELDATKAERDELARRLVGLTGEEPRSPDETTVAARTGRLPPGTLGTMVLLALVLGCGPAREALLTVTPGVPPASGCVAGAYRCADGAPETCSASGRWWRTLPVDVTGAPRRCPAGCALSANGVAHCAPADGGAR